MTVLGLASGRAGSLVPKTSTLVLQSGEMPGLDGLRALSVLVVIIGHLGFGNVVPAGLGVTVFFFISGFLITTLLLREFHTTDNIAIGQFYARRLLRLKPELWAFFLISGLGGGILEQYWPTHLDVISGILYFSNYAKEGVLTGGHIPDMRWPQLWSLAVEEHYYLTYPLLFTALIKAPVRLLAVLLSALVVCLALRFFYFNVGAATDYIYSVTETRLDSIAYGCIGSLALWYMPETAIAWLRRWTAIFVIVSIFLLVASLGLRTPLFRDTLRYSLQGFALTLLFVGFYAGDIGWEVKLLEVPILKWMGRMSYGAYLWHLDVIGGVRHLMHWPAQADMSPFCAIKSLILITLSFVAAYLSYRLFQKPVLALRRQFGSHSG